jgi:hypothetical protein
MGFMKLNGPFLMGMVGAELLNIKKIQIVNHYHYRIKHVE